MLGPLLTGVVPEHPEAVDHLAALSDWQMLGNSEYGDCVSVTWSNVRRLMTRLAGSEQYPSIDQVIEFYKTQNPGFPAEDEGMVIQTALEYLAAQGGPDGAKAVCFAKVDHTNLDEVKAAISIFGYVWTGIDVLEVNTQQFEDGQPWDYIAASPKVGGHSVVTGGYDSDQIGADVRFITWAEETGFTNLYWAQCVEEAWVVVWSEHLGMRAFQEGIDQAKLAQAYQTLTGQILPQLPPPPVAAPFLDADPRVAEHILHSAARAKLTPSQYLNKHFAQYFRLGSL